MSDIPIGSRKGVQPPDGRPGIGARRGTFTQAKGPDAKKPKGLSRDQIASMRGETSKPIFTPNVSNPTSLDYISQTRGAVYDVSIFGLREDSKNPRKILYGLTLIITLLVLVKFFWEDLPQWVSVLPFGVLIGWIWYLIKFGNVHNEYNLGKEWVYLSTGVSALSALGLFFL